MRVTSTKRDYESALKEIDRLWGAKAGTRDGDRLDVRLRWPRRSWN